MASSLLTGLEEWVLAMLLLCEHITMKLERGMLVITQTWAPAVEGVG